MASERWTPGRAWDWQRARPWMCGCNFLPSTAVNSIEMLQAGTFDAETIERELGWAAALGMNIARVFVPYVVWKADADGLLVRLDQVLGIASAHGIALMPVLLDDCHNAAGPPAPGKQPEPVPGVHNSQWTGSPGARLVQDRAAWPALEAYVHGVVSRFGADPRVAVWDLYNEPCNGVPAEASLALADAAFAWARAAGPQQPLTVGEWHAGLADLNALCAARSDVLSFHSYEPLDAMQRRTEHLLALGRPVICTEWMARTLGSAIETHLPWFAASGVGCVMWGLVAGRTQTLYPWGSPEGAPPPDLWFHDVLHADGTPYRAEEADLLRHVTASARKPGGHL